MGSQGDYIVKSKEKDGECKEVSSEGKVYLKETFYISSKKNHVFIVKLTDVGLCLRKEANSSTKEQIIKINDIVGCRCLRSQKKPRGRAACTCSSSVPRDKSRVSVEDDNFLADESDVSAYLYVYAYVFKKSLRNNCRRERTVLTLRFRSYDKFDDNIREAQKWRTTIKRLMLYTGDVLQLKSAISAEQKKLLVILNPKSGSGKARELYQQQVAPIYGEAEIPIELHVTKRANFARELVRHKHDIFSYRGIVVCGGDGIYYEVINGIMEREDWDDVFQNIPIGIIPCGSGNGLARSIAHVYNEPYEPKPILNAAITTAKGKTAWMDLVRVETKAQIMFSFLSIGWGLISDIDIESERLRYMGHQRFSLWSLRRLIGLRTYHGKISYIPASTELLNATSAELPPPNRIKHSISCNTYLTEEGGSQDADGEVITLETANDGFFDTIDRQRLDSFYSTTSRKTAYYSVAGSEYKSINGSIRGDDEDFPDHDKVQDNTSYATSNPKDVQVFGPSSSLPSLMSPVPGDWVVEEGDYVMVHATYQTHLSSDVFFVPSSKLSDGIIWLVIIKAGVTRPALLNFMMGLSSGTHLPDKEHNYFKVIPVTAFRIEPTGNDGILTVDGERVDYGPIQGEVCSSLAKVMVPEKFVKSL
ncbi:SPHK1 family protein [Megaselia abdita]